MSLRRREPTQIDRCWPISCAGLIRGKDFEALQEVTAEKGAGAPSKFERFVVERNGKADEPATEGASLDGAVIAEHYARDVKQGRMEVHATVEYAAHVHACVENWKDRDEIIPNTPKCEIP